MQLVRNIPSQSCIGFAYDIAATLLFLLAHRRKQKMKEHINTF